MAVRLGGLLFVVEKYLCTVTIVIQGSAQNCNTGILHTHVIPSLWKVTPFSDSMGRESAPCGFGLIVIDEVFTSFGSFSSTCGNIEAISV